MRRQYVVAELFPSISDTEDDGVEFCWRTRPEAGGFSPEAACTRQYHGVFVLVNLILTKRYDRRERC